MKTISAVLLLCAVNAAARPVPALMPPPKPMHSSDRTVEERLREWLDTQSFSPNSQKKVDPEMADLRDAVASPSPDLRADIQKAEGSRRTMLAERLPGMGADPFDYCRVLESCKARVSFHVESEENVRDAVAALVRPWIIVEKARSQSLSFAPAPEGDKLIDLTVPSAPDAGLAVHVAAVSTGGYDVWLTGKTDPAQLFQKERSAALPAQ